MFDSSGSYIKSCVTLCRFHLNSATGDRFSDNFLVTWIFSEAFSQVMSRIALAQENPVVMGYDFTLDADTARYTFPPTLSEVWWVGEYDTNNRLKCVLQADGLLSAYPRSTAGGWKLDGNQLIVDPAPNQAVTLRVVGTINNSISAHYATDGIINSTTSVTLSASPALGINDRRENAYAGQYIRILTGDAIEERVIEAYDPGTRVATLRSPITASSGTVSYEVGPPSFPSFVQVIACKMALLFSANLEMSRAGVTRLELMYEQALKTVLDQTSHMNIARGKAIELDSVLAAT